MLRFVNLLSKIPPKGIKMSRSFDYQSASVDAIAVRLNTVQEQAYYRLVTYYNKKNDESMLAKLAQAKKLSKIFKLQAEYAREYCDA
jgi:hypothetical protein